MPIITVKCPKCREVMEIDTLTGRIEKHHSAVKPRPGSDFLAERLKSLEGEKSRREAIVAEGREKEKGRKAAHDKLFARVKEGSGEGPPAERPLRDIDLD